MRRDILFSTSFVLLALLLLAAPGFASSSVCGTPAVTTLFAGQTIAAGTVRVYNDSTNLYVEYTTASGWYLQETHLAIATSLAGIPQTRSGNPKVGNFPYKRAYNPVVQTDLYVFPLSELAAALGTNPFTCGVSSLVVAAHAVVVRLDGNGGVIGQETGWGSGTGFPGANWAMYFNYTIQCCPPPVIEPGDFRTQTQGGWGASCSGNNPGCYRDSHFASCFTGGLVAGSSAGFTAAFTSSGAVQAFLPQGGPAGALSQNHVDPTSTEARVLAGQVVALSLSVGFDGCDPAFGASPIPLADLVVCEAASACEGMTVGEVLDEANAVLGGLASGFSPSSINDCVSRINESFVDGTTVGTYLCLP